MTDQPKLGADLIIRYPEERFVRRHARVTRRQEHAGAMGIKEELPDGDVDGELYDDQLLMVERVVAARPGGAIRIGYVIEQIIASDNLERPVSPQRAGPSGLNAHLPPFRRRVDSSDKDEPELPVWPPRRPHLEFDDGDYEQEEDT